MKHISAPLILKDKFTVFPFLASFVLLAFAFFIVYLNLSDVSNILVIHFDSYKGIDFFGNKDHVFGMLFLGLFILVLNGFLANILYLRERFLSYVLSFSTTIFSILIFISILVIISVN